MSCLKFIAAACRRVLLDLESKKFGESVRFLSDGNPVGDMETEAFQLEKNEQLLISYPSGSNLDVNHHDL